MMCLKAGTLLVSAIVALVCVGIGPCQAGSPTPKPAKAPSRDEKEASPTQLSLHYPTVQPTAAPSSSGSLSKTSDTPIQRLEAFGLSMKMEGLVLPLSLASRIVLETITGDTIYESVLKVLGSNQIEDMEVVVTLTSTKARTLLRGSAGWNASAMHRETILFDVLILIRSVIEEHDLNRYILSAFNDPMDKIYFISTLKASGEPAFVNVSTVSVTPSRVGEATDSPRAETIEDNDENTTNNTIYLVAAIISVTVATTAFMIPAVCFVQYNIQRKREQRRLQGIFQNDSVKLDSDRYNDEDVASEIVELGSAIDLSTLSDSLLTTGSNSGDRVLRMVDYAALGSDSGQYYHIGTNVATEGDICVASEDNSVYSYAYSVPTLPSDDEYLLSFLEESMHPDSRSLPLPTNDSTTLLVGTDDLIGTSMNSSVLSDSLLAILQSPCVDTFSLTETEIYYDAKSLPLPVTISCLQNNDDDSKSLISGTFPSDSHSAPLLSRGETLTSMVGTEVVCDTSILSLPSKGNTATPSESNDDFESVLDGSLHSEPLPWRHETLLSPDGSEILCETSSLPAPVKKDCVWEESGSEKTCPTDDTGYISNPELSSSDSAKEATFQSNVVISGFSVVSRQEDSLDESKHNAQEE